MFIFPLNLYHYWYLVCSSFCVEKVQDLLLYLVSKQSDPKVIVSPFDKSCISYTNHLSTIHPLFTLGLLTLIRRGNNSVAKISTPRVRCMTLMKGGN